MAVGTEGSRKKEIISTFIFDNEAKWSHLYIPRGCTSSRNVRRGSRVLPRTSFTSDLTPHNFNFSNELASSVRRCFVGATKGSSSHKVMMDERGMTIDVGTKLLFTIFRHRSDVMDRMSCC